MRSQGYFGWTYFIPESLAFKYPFAFAPFVITLSFATGYYFSYRTFGPHIVPFRAKLLKNSEDEDTNLTKRFKKYFNQTNKCF